MTDQTASLLRLYRFPSGRRLFAVQAVLAAATRLGEQPAIDLATQCVTTERAARKLQRAWRSQKSAEVATRAFELDPRVDRLVSTLHEIPARALSTLPASHPRAAQATAYINALFPDGPAAITRLPYEEEVVAVEDLLELLLADEMQETIVRFALTDYVSELAQLVPQYRAEIEASPKGEVVFRQVRDALVDGQRHLVRLVALLLGVWAQDPGKGAELMAPILQQQDRIGAALRSKRRVSDVDPDTGEEEPEASPAPQDAPTA
jgi:hypothetical protein